MNDIQKIFRQYQHLSLSVIMIVLAIAGIFLGIIPGIQRIIDIRARSVELTKSIQLLRTKINILESKDEATYKDQLTQLVAAVPGDKSPQTLFATLDGLGAQSGVVLTDFALSALGSISTGSGSKRTPDEQKIGSSLVPFSVTVRGTYDQIHLYLSQVNQVRRFFRVRNFAISFADASDISVRMGMDAFYAPMLTMLTTVESPLEPLSAQDEDLIQKITQMPFLGRAATLPVPLNPLPPSEQRPTLFAP
jgi:hypothetical protein